MRRAVPLFGSGSGIDTGRSADENENEQRRRRDEDEREKHARKEKEKFEERRGVKIISILSIVCGRNCVWGRFHRSDESRMEERERLGVE